MGRLFLQPRPGTLERCPVTPHGAGHAKDQAKLRTIPCCSLTRSLLGRWLLQMSACWPGPGVVLLADSRPRAEADGRAGLGLHWAGPAFGHGLHPPFPSPCPFTSPQRAWASQSFHRKEAQWEGRALYWPRHSCRLTSAVSAAASGLGPAASRAPAANSQHPPWALLPGSLSSQEAEGSAQSLVLPLGSRREEGGEEEGEGRRKVKGGGKREEGGE